MQRRSFIKLSAIAAWYVLHPVLLNAKKNSKKTLVLIELHGGNDALNTVIPYTSKVYYNLRPTLALPKSQMNIINKQFGLNKNLSNIHALYQDNNVAIINGLGYAKPNLSHFRSIEIVETASMSDQFLDEGWVAQYLHSKKSSVPIDAMVIGKRNKGKLFSNDLNVLQIKNINKFLEQSNRISSVKSIDGFNENLKYVQEQQNLIVRANTILKKYISKDELKYTFDDSQIALDFKEALKIIKTPLDIPIIKIAQKSYDTHANQLSTQNSLLKDLDSALGSFVKELKSNDLFDDVLIVTYSEFGRRVKENASMGTDHGTASSQFVIGGKVKGGMYGHYPDLRKLIKDNMIYTTEYKSLYNTILSGWFNDQRNPYRNFEKMKFL
ncbi:MAG: DUF1501 domain-containing protein [Campylobacterota bacterium]|nr:DUF1501 domain-containing protein [Campylobacterota bacterium]